MAARCSAQPGPPGNPGRLRKMQASSAWRVIHVPSFCSFMIPLRCPLSWNCHWSGVSVAAAAATRSRSASSVKCAPYEQQPCTSSGAASVSTPLHPDPKMHVHRESRNVRSKTQVRSSSGSSNDSHSCRSVGESCRARAFAMRVRSVRGVPSDFVPGEFDEIRSRLQTISEELADLAIARLRDSIDAGGSELPVDERRLTRARRAVEKAIGILQEPDDHD